MSELLIVVGILILILAIPGCLFVVWVKNDLDKNSILISIPFFSISFWICSIWFISFFKLPFDKSVLILWLSMSIYLFFLIKREINIPEFKIKHIYNFKNNFNFSYPNLLLAIVLLLYFIPILFIVVPPGADTAMHGYITRLIINNNGIPKSYYPILPIENFGSYSVGLHTISAIVSTLKETNIAYSITSVSLVSYQLCILGLIFLLYQFISWEAAVVSGTVSIMLCRVPQDSFGWGGNPTVLSFALCLFVTALFIKIIKIKSTKLNILCALPLAAIPLTHAIPAISFFYIGGIGVIILLVNNLKEKKWILSNLILLGTITALLLTPFLINFNNPITDDLLKTIKAWQGKMGPDFTQTFFGNLIAVVSEIKYRLGDPFDIMAVISIILLVVWKDTKKIIYPLFFSLIILLIILNSHYWSLPFSYLLYPERVVFFLIIPFAYLFGTLVEKCLMKKSDALISNESKKIKVTNIIIIIFLIIAPVRSWNHFLKNGVNTDVNQDVLSAFTWINNNTEQNALFKVTYPGPGIWIPTFTNRPTLNTHVHFIHSGVFNEMYKMKSPRYLFITKVDINTNANIIKEIIDMKNVYQNGEIKIYKKL